MCLAQILYIKFIKDLGHCLKLASEENIAYPFLVQRLSVAVQWRNAASVMGSLSSEEMDQRTFLCNLCLFVISYIMLSLLLFYNSAISNTNCIVNTTINAQ